MTRLRFEGEICGFGTTSGYRIVIGRWPSSPLGAITDAMVEGPDGYRTLVAPDRAAAEYIGATYVFDDIAVGPVVAVRSAHALVVHGPGLEATVSFGRRPPLGLLLRAVPRPVARAPWFAALADPVARVLLPGVRTRGSAGAGRREWYGAHDLHAVTAVRASWQGLALGALAPRATGRGVGGGAGRRGRRAGGARRAGAAGGGRGGGGAPRAARGRGKRPRTQRQAAVGAMARGGGGEALVGRAHFGAHVA